MKRVLCLIAVMTLLAVLPGYSEENPSLFRTLKPYETYVPKVEEKGSWASDQDSIASVSEKGEIFAHEAGQAVITLTVDDKQVYAITINVETEPEVPEVIQRAINLGIAEWEQAQGTTFKKKNKYTNWYYGPSASFGWCGAFTSFSLGEAGLEQEATNTWRQAKPLPDGQPHGIREAGVPKLLSGYTNMDRTTQIPRPGYLVIYGRRGGYKTLHVGLVTAVFDRGEGVYQVETVEGNLANRIKRLTYLYDSKVVNHNQKNLSILPEDERVAPEVFQYRLTDENWRVTTFAQTWY